MLLHFPQMHPDLLPASLRAALPAEVRFLDPGLGKADSPDHQRPELAPFDPRTAKALLNDTLRFGESLADPRDILPQGLVERAETLKPESSRAVLADVAKSVMGAAASAPDSIAPPDAARQQAQLVLLLAWNLEERLIELLGVEAKLKTAWDRLDQSVAAGEDVVDDEADHEALSQGLELSGLTLPDATTVPLPWRKLLECYAVLAPGSALTILDADIAATLAEDGVPEGPLADMPGAVRVFRAQAWRFLGHDRLPQDKPWLDTMLSLGVYVPLSGKE